MDMTSSLIKLHVLLVFFHLCLVSLLKVLGEYNVTILPHRQHSRFLADRVDVGSADLIGTRDNCGNNC